MYEHLNIVNLAMTLRVSVRGVWLTRIIKASVKSLSKMGKKYAWKAEKGYKGDQSFRRNWLVRQLYLFEFKRKILFICHHLLNFSQLNSIIFKAAAILTYNLHYKQ